MTTIWCVAQDADDRETRLSAERVIIATGSSPLRPPACRSMIRVSSTPRRSPISPANRANCSSSGRAPIGVEYATIFSALGVPVTILDSAPRLAAMMDSEISHRLQQVLLAGETG